jgi:hypothetical protein
MRGGAVKVGVVGLLLATSCRQLLDIKDGELLSAEDGGGVGGEAGGDVPLPPLCERYCDAVMARCSGADAVYTSREACDAVCAALPPGIPGDGAVNSVECRMRAARAAVADAARFCPVAGPGGNGDCGSNCASLCGLRQQICADYASDDADSCLESCAALPDLGTYSVDSSAAQDSGPHVQCRLYHLSAAAVSEMEQQCLSVDGADPCR